MNQRSFSLLAGVIFTIIALLHLLRIIYGWDPVVEGWTVPKWISIGRGWILGVRRVTVSYQIETELAFVPLVTRKIQIWVDQSTGAGVRARSSVPKAKSRAETP